MNQNNDRRHVIYKELSIRINYNLFKSYDPRVWVKNRGTRGA